MTDQDASQAADKTRLVSEWRRGWTLIAAVALGIGTSSIASTAMGVLLPPLTRAYGWSRAEFSAGFMIVTFVSLLGSTPVGVAVDRFGARRVALLAMAAGCVAVAALGLAAPSILSWYVATLVLGLASAAGSSVVWLSAVAGRFEHSRAFAMAVSLMGIGLTQIIVPPLTTLALGWIGLRLVFPILAAGFLLTLPIVWLFFFDTADLRRTAKTPASQGPASVAKPPGLTFGQAISTFRFWRLTAAVVLIAAGAGVINLHLVPMLIDSGASPLAAAAALSARGPATMFGRVAAGYLLDRLGVPLVASAIFLLSALGFVLLSHVGKDAGLAALCVCLVSIASSTELDVAAFAASRYFGLRSFGAIYGLLYGLAVFLWGLAPVAAAAIKDQLGTYQPALTGALVAALLSSLLAATLGRYPTFPERPEGARLTP